MLNVKLTHALVSQRIISINVILDTCLETDITVINGATWLQYSYNQKSLM